MALSDIFSYYKLDEAANVTRNDSIGSLHLADNSSAVGSVAGVIGNAARFTEGGSWLKGSLGHSGNLTVFVRFRWRAGLSLSTPGIFGKWGAGDQRSFTLRYDTTAARVIFGVSGDGTSGAVVTATANTFGTITGDVWYFAVGYCDHDTNLIGVSVSTLGANTTSVFDTTAFTGTLFNSSADLEIGRLGTSTEVFHADIDTAGIANTVLTSADLTDLWNGSEPPFVVIPDASFRVQTLRPRIFAPGLAR